LTSGIAKNGGRLLFFVGEKDFLITAQQRDEIAHALRDSNVRHEMIVYPDVQHGFFCDERDTFDEASRDDAWQRTLKLFASELRS